MRNFENNEASGGGSSPNLLGVGKASGATKHKHDDKRQVRLIDRWGVLGMLGISDSTLDRIIMNDLDFPVPFVVGARSIRWLEHEVEQYIYGLERSDRFA